MKFSKNKIILICLLLLVMFVFCGCVPGDGNADAENTAGFFWGIWHGWLAPISLIISLFNRNIRIYEVYNSGWWYDFGFYMAVISGFGGLALSRKKSNVNKSDN
jgi:hypothetical protein